MTLHGLKVMVTRPAHQAARLCELIRAAGGEPLAFPVLDIVPAADRTAARAAFARLADYDIALFVSANAVDHAAPYIEEQGGLPPGLRLAAVGRRTAEALRARYGRADIEGAPPYNSESLLAAAAFTEVAGRRILIVRGAGGRELLAETLRARGAEVDYAEVYQRLAAAGDLDAVLDTHPDLDVFVVTSNDSLRQLMDKAGARHRSRLLAAQLVVISPRTAELATELGFTRPAAVARAATDEALLEAIAEWRATAAAETPPPQPSAGAAAATVADAAPRPAAPPGPPPAAAVPPPAPRRRRKRRVARVGAIVAALAVLWMAAGVYLLWRELSEVQSALDREIAAAAAARAEAARLGERLDRAENQLGSVVTSDLEELHNEQRGIGQLLEELRNQIERSPRSWTLAETAHLLRIANDRLQLDGDIPTTVAALEAADRRLQEFNDPSLFEVRRLLATEIEALRALPAADITGLALRLRALDDGVGQLPFPERPAAAAAPAEPVAADGWRNVLHGLWQELRQLVVVRHKSDADAPLPTAERHDRLRENLRLTLETAQLALLRRDNAVFHDSLRRAHDWLSRHFDTAHPAVQGALAELARMQAVDIAPALPNISASARALDEWQMQRRGGGDTGGAAP